MSKKLKKQEKRYQEARKRALLVLEANPALVPLLEAFSVMDDVFTTEDAFSSAHIHKSLGRCYRAWKKCRAELDPEFDPADYPKKPRKIKRR